VKVTGSFVRGAISGEREEKRVVVVVVGVVVRSRCHRPMNGRIIGGD